MRSIKNFYSGLAIASLAVMYSCADAPKGDDAKITEEQKTAQATGVSFAVDTADSRIRFTGHDRRHEPSRGI